MMTGKIQTVVLCALAVLFLTAAPGAWHAAEAKKKEPEKVSLPKTPDDLDLIDLGQVTEVTRSDTIKLSNGKIYRLAHIRVPVFHEDKAVAFLRQETMGRTVGIYLDKADKNPEKDRYGNLYAHVLRDDNTWVQADMIARGLSWAYSTEQTRRLIIPLYKYEALAQKMKAGFWKDPEFAPKDKNNIVRYVNSYQIFTCYINNALFLPEKIVLNCAVDAAKGYFVTFAISYDKVSNFMSEVRHARFYFLKWRGGVVVVRGWVEKDTTINPGSLTSLVNVTHPEQLDFIDPKTGESTTKYE